MPSSEIFAFTDPYTYQKAIRGGDVEVVVTGAGDYRAELMRADLDRLWIQRSWQSLPYIARATLHKNQSGIMFLAGGRGASMRIGGLQIPPEEVVFTSSSTEFYQCGSAGSGWAGLSLTPDDLAVTWRDVVGRDLSLTGIHRIRPCPELQSRLSNLHKAAGDLAATVPDLLAHPEVAKAIRQALVYAMISCLSDPAGTKRGRSGRHRAGVMRRFEEALEANGERPLYIPELCAQLGVSDRTLRAQCQEHLGMSPHHYLWLRRMHLARRALGLADGTRKSVTEIALDHGLANWDAFRSRIGSCSARCPR